MFSSHSKTGFTLFEVIIATSMFAIVAFGLSRLDRDTFVLANVFESEFNISIDSRKILKPMVQEIRGATTSHDGSYAIGVADPGEFLFFGDIDADGNIERVRYFIENGTLNKATIEPSGSPLSYDENDEVIAPIVRNITNTDIFEYFDSSYNGLTPALVQPVDINVIRLVKISFTIDEDPDDLTDPFEVSTQVSIRNLKDNL